MAAVTVHSDSDFGAQENKVSVSIISPEVMGPNAMIFIF